MINNLSLVISKYAKEIVESHQKEVSFEGSWLSCMAPVEVDQKQDAWFAREAFKSMLVRYSIYNKIQS